MSNHTHHTPPSAPPGIVIDTNCVLDLWVFRDPAVQALHTALLQGRLHWLATAAMRAELQRVLAYPQIAPRLDREGLDSDEVMAAFDRHSLPCAPAPLAPVRCRDRDDQPFIDLAVQTRATLLSKDARVLGLARALRPLGVSVLRRWPTEA